MVDNGHISKETGNYLTPTDPRTVRFYHLPKIHKPGNPGRPIVSFVEPLQNAFQNLLITTCSH